MPQDFETDVEKVSRIEAVPTILDVVCRTTGMRFAAVARVTEERWIACSVLDQIDFGLRPGGELQLETTICHEIRQSRQPVIIDNVSEDRDWCGHPTPAMYQFSKFISRCPSFWRMARSLELCFAIDPRPARLSTPEPVGVFQLFAELIDKRSRFQPKDGDDRSSSSRGTGGRGTSRAVSSLCWVTICARQSGRSTVSRNRWRRKRRWIRKR